MTSYDMSQSPRRQSPLLMPLVWGGSYIMTRRHGLKIEKQNMKGLKPPFLVFATHQGFSDYYIAPLALFPHRAIYVSDVEGFTAFGKGLYRALGCIAKRRYVPDISVIINIRRALKMGQSVVLYPESRHSNIGITAAVPDNLGKLAKSLGVPVVILSANGSYLANPFWNEEVTRKVPIRARLECICDKERLSKVTSDELQREIEKKLKYNEYEYQQQRGFRISDRDRAQGLEKALFCCRSCGKKYGMKTDGSILSCNYCKRQWELTEDGRLVSGSESISPPDWYLWQKKLIEDETKNDMPARVFPVRTEALPNEKGFVSLGNGTLQLDKEGFTLSFEGDGAKHLTFPHRIRESVQTEYNYRGRGCCIVLSTVHCCYYIYSDAPDFSPTELQYIGEWFYNRSKRGAEKS